MLYAGLVIYSTVGESPPPAPILDVVAEAAPAATGALAETADGLFLTTADGRVLEISAIVTTAVAVEDTAEVAAFSTSQGAPRAEQGTEADAIGAQAETSPGAPALPVVTVTGSTVNLRGGPSTDTEVLASLPRGTEAYLLASVGDGWAQIRVAATGVEGFMADRFLAAAN